MVAIQIEIHGRLQLSGMSATAREFTFAPVLQECFVYGQKVPPRNEHALSIRLQAGPARDEVQVRHIGAVAIEQDDFFKAVIGQRARDIEHMLHKVLKVIVDRARKVHHVAGVTVGHDRQHQYLFGCPFPCSGCDSAGTDQVDIQRQMRTVLLNGSTGQDADFTEVDGVIDLRPGEFLVSVFGYSSTTHGENSVVTVKGSCHF